MAKRGRRPYPDVLTPREWQVLSLLREGLTNPEIAARWSISRDTVKTHVSDILSKLGVSTREEAARWGESRWVLGGLAGIWRPWLRVAWITAAGTLSLGAIAGLAFLVFLLARGGHNSDAGANRAPTPLPTLHDASGETRSFSSVFFVDAQTGWVSGFLGGEAGGAMLKTTDGGRTWQRQYTGSKVIGGLQFVSPEVGWAVADPHRGDWDVDPLVLLHTVDGGATW